MDKYTFSIERTEVVEAEGLGQAVEMVCANLIHGETVHFFSFQDGEGGHKLDVTIHTEAKDEA